MDAGFLARRDEGVCWAQMTEEQQSQGRGGRARNAQDFLITALTIEKVFINGERELVAGRDAGFIVHVEPVE